MQDISIYVSSSKICISVNSIRTSLTDRSMTWFDLHAGKQVHTKTVVGSETCSILLSA
mgnify:CR=1 FL=1